MIHVFVDKIVVHEVDRSSGERTREVDIYLKFIGKFDAPMPDPTAEKLAEQERLRKKWTKKCEFSQLCITSRWTLKSNVRSRDLGIVNTCSVRWGCFQFLRWITNKIMKGDMIFYDIDLKEL